MPGIDLLAIVVAAIIAFVGSFGWYILFAKELAKVSPAFAEGQNQRRQPWKMLFVLVEIFSHPFSPLFGFCR